jgi:hypothetical protein
MKRKEVMKSKEEDRWPIGSVEVSGRRYRLILPLEKMSKYRRLFHQK